jgi:hypothetical protein
VSWLAQATSKALALVRALLVHCAELALQVLQQAQQARLVLVQAVLQVLQALRLQVLVHLQAGRLLVQGLRVGSPRQVGLPQQALLAAVLQLAVAQVQVAG